MVLCRSYSVSSVSSVVKVVLPAVSSPWLSMRERLGMTCQVAGLILMPLALLQGMQEGASLGNELLLAAVGFLLIFVGRGLRSGAGSK